MRSINFLGVRSPSNFQREGHPDWLENVAPSAVNIGRLSSFLRTELATASRDIILSVESVAMLPSSLEESDTVMFRRVALSLKRSALVAN